MLNSKGFDLWADGYDKTVELSEEDDTYPFAGYKSVLGTIYQTIKENEGNKILDIGFGTGVLTQKLYQDGYEIFGMDFSEKMIEIAKGKMPKATLIKHDFSKGYPSLLETEKFDFITCTYAIHHLDNQQKAIFINELIKHLSDGGMILIGDIAFEKMDDLNQCKAICGDEWDDEEIYMVEETMKKEIPSVEFKKITFCSGVFMIKKVDSPLKKRYTRTAS